MKKRRVSPIILPFIKEFIDIDMGGSLAFIAVLLVHAEASEVTFTSTPQILDVTTTHNMYMRCAVSDSHPTSGGTGSIVGRRRDLDLAANDGDLLLSGRDLDLVAHDDTLGASSSCNDDEEEDVDTNDPYLTKSRDDLQTQHEPRRVKGQGSSVKDGGGRSISGVDVTTSGDIKHVESMSVSRDGGQYVAMVTRYDGAKAVNDTGSLGQLVVRGNVDVNGPPKERGYLELTWQSPSPHTEGVYTCHVTGIDQLGRVLTVTGTLEVITTLTLAQLKSHTHLQNETTKLESEINKLQNEAVLLTTENAKLKNDSARMTDHIMKLQDETSQQQTEIQSLRNTTQQVESLSTHIVSLEEHSSAMKQHIDDLLGNLTSLQADCLTLTAPTTQSSNISCVDVSAVSSLHIEQGRIECNNSVDWARDDQRDWAGSKMDLHYHKFDTPYTSKPFIQVGVSSIDHETDANTRYDVFVRSVDTKGFTLECRTWADSKLYHVYVDWIAVAS